MRNASDTDIPSEKTASSYFDERLLHDASDRVREHFYSKLDARQREMIDRIARSEFATDEDDFRGELDRLGLSPERRLHDEQRSGQHRRSIYDGNHALHEGLVSGKKTIGIIDIRGSSKMDYHVVQSKLLKMHFLMTLFEEVFDKQRFAIITPSFGDDAVFGMLGENRAHEDFAVLKLLYGFMKRLGVEFNLYVDRARITSDQFILLFGKHSVSSTNIGGLNRFCNEYAFLRKQGRISKHIGSSLLDTLREERGGSIEGSVYENRSKVLHILRGDQSPRGMILSDSAFDRLMSDDGETKMLNPFAPEIEWILQESKIGRILAGLIKTNDLPVERFIMYESAPADMNIIRGGFRNDNLYFVKGTMRVRPLIGEEKVLTGFHIAGEGSLLQKHRSIANADCDIPKGAQYLKISHALLNAIIDGSPLDMGDGRKTVLMVHPSDKRYLLDLLQGLNGRRQAENMRKAA